MANVRIQCRRGCVERRGRTEGSREEKSRTQQDAELNQTGKDKNSISGMLVAEGGCKHTALQGRSLRRERELTGVPKSGQHEVFGRSMSLDLHQESAALAASALAINATRRETKRSKLRRPHHSQSERDRHQYIADRFGFTALRAQTFRPTWPVLRNKA